MNEFDRRWQDCADRARQAADRPLPVTAGLATRVWSRFAASPAARQAGVLSSLSFRAVVLATIALLACAAMDFYTTSPENVFAPHLEDVVTSIWQTQ